MKIATNKLNHVATLSTDNTQSTQMFPMIRPCPGGMIDGLMKHTVRHRILYTFKRNEQSITLANMRQDAVYTSLHQHVRLEGVPLQKLFQSCWHGVQLILVQFYKFIYSFQMKWYHCWDQLNSAILNCCAVATQMSKNSTIKVFS